MLAASREDAYATPIKTCAQNAIFITMRQSALTKVSSLKLVKRSWLVTDSHRKGSVILVLGKLPSSVSLASCPGPQA